MVKNTIILLVLYFLQFTNTISRSRVGKKSRARVAWKKRQAPEPVKS